MIMKAFSGLYVGYRPHPVTVYMLQDLAAAKAKMLDFCVPLLTAPKSRLKWGFLAIIGLAFLRGSVLFRGGRWGLAEVDGDRSTASSALTLATQSQTFFAASVEALP